MRIRLRKPRHKYVTVVLTPERKIVRVKLKKRLITCHLCKVTSKQKLPLNFGDWYVCDDCRKPGAIGEWYSWPVC